MNVPPLAPGREPWRLPEGRVLVIDIETDGLLDVCTRLHSLVARDFHTRAVVANLGGPEGTSAEGVRRALDEADVLVAHNGLRFDFPGLKQLVGWEPRADQSLVDTLVLVRLIFSDIMKADLKLTNDGTLPRNLFGSHSMEAWGYRLGEKKVGTEIEDWSTWTTLMQERCESDTLVNLKLLEHLLSFPYSKDAVENELRVAQIHAVSELVGFPFDVGLAEEVTAELCVRRAELDAQIRSDLGGWWKAKLDAADRERGHKVPTKSRKAWEASGLGTPVNRGPKRKPEWVPGWNWEFTEGAPYTPVEWNVLNPSSRPQIVEFLGRLRGWVPVDFNEDTGSPKVDESVLGKLPWPEAKLLAKYLTVQKRLGMIAEGKKGWLRVVKRHYRPEGGWDDRIHGAINTNGAVTGRPTHHEPNLAQVPKVKTKETKDGTGTVVEKIILKGEAGGWGYECRSMFRAPAGMVLVGADLSALQLVALAHHLAFYDGGAYYRAITERDPHEYMAEVAGVPTRGQGKTLNYCVIFGGGDKKIGHTAKPTAPDNEKIEIGKRLREVIYKGITGLGELNGVLDEFAKGPKFKPDKPWRDKTKARGWLYGLDGRHIPIRHPHAVLNTALQSFEAMIAKRWQVILENALAHCGLVHGRDWFMHVWPHDEIQFSIRPEFAEDAAKIAVEAAAAAGRFYNLRVPIKAEARIGRTWAETH